MEHLTIPFFYDSDKSGHGERARDPASVSDVTRGTIGMTSNSKKASNMTGEIGADDDVPAVETDSVSSDID